MQKVSFQLKTEFLWLLAAAVLTIMIAYNRFGKSITDDTLDLHLHDTFFVISRWMVLIPLFLLVTFLVFFIKTQISKTSTDFSYIVFILSGLALGISITLIIKTLSISGIVGFTTYPPLTALGITEISPPNMDSFSIFLINSLTAIQIIILGITIYSAFQFGIKKHKQSI